MTNKELIKKTITFVKNELKNAEGGHDWWHVYRVWRLAKKIGKKEKVDEQVVELAALLHDVADAKFHNGNDTIGPEIAGEFLRKMKVNENKVRHIQNIIGNVSFHHVQTFHSKELEVVQDADRLDAIGAIGIARTFNYGGHKQRELYNPTVELKAKKSKEEYRTSQTPTINHFYEKLLLLKDLMNTKTAKEMAKQRHAYMKKFLKEFFDEWEGKK